VIAKPFEIDALIGVARTILAEHQAALDIDAASRPVLVGENSVSAACCSW
jgi:hypothetical protein